MPSAAPPSAPKISPSTTSSAIFMEDGTPVDDRKQPGDKSAQAAVRFNGEATVFGLHSPSNHAGLAGQHVRDIALQYLLHQIEGIQDLADLGDTPLAQGVERGEVELHDPLVVP